MYYQVIQKQLRDLSTEEIQLIAFSIGHAYHLNIFKNSLRYKGKVKNLKAVSIKAVSNISKKPSQLPEDGSIDTERGIREINALEKTFGVNSLNPETETMRLDAHNEIGLSDIVKKVQTGEIKWDAIITETFFESFSDGTNEMYKYKQGALDLILKRKGDIDVESWSHYLAPGDGILRRIKKGLFRRNLKSNIDIQTVNAPDAGTIKITKAERLAALLNDRNETNKENILKKGVSLKQTPTQIHKLTEADWNAILDSATLEEKTMVDAFFDYYNVYAPPKINKVSLELNNFEVALEPSYYPKITNKYDRHRDFLKKPDNLTPKTLFNFSNTTLEGMGPLKERTGALNAIVLEDAFRAFIEHINLMGAYIGYANPLRNAKALLYHPTFEKELINRWGKQNWDYLNEYIQSIEAHSFDTTSFDKLALETMNKIDPALLVSPGVVLKQPVSLWFAALEFDGKYFRKGMGKIVGKKTKEEMNKHSAFFRNRDEAGTMNIETGEVVANRELRRIFTGKQTFSQRVMAPIRWGDFQAIGRIWEMAKAEVEDKYPNLIDKDFWMVVEKRTRQVEGVGVLQ